MCSPKSTKNYLTEVFKSAKNYVRVYLNVAMSRSEDDICSSREDEEVSVDETKVQEVEITTIVNFANRAPNALLCRKSWIRLG